MSVYNYNPTSNDIIIGNFSTTIDWGYGVYCTVIMNGRRDTGSGWRYAVHYGYYFDNPGYFIMDAVYCTLELWCGGGYGAYWGQDNRPVTMNVHRGYWLFPNSFDIDIPYGANISGTVNFVAHNVDNPPNWSAKNRGFNIGWGVPPAPIPAVPTMYFNDPTGVTENTVNLRGFFYGNAEQLDWYYMILRNETTGEKLYDPALTEYYTDRHGTAKLFEYTIRNLKPDTSYTFSLELRDNRKYEIKQVERKTIRTKFSGRLFEKVSGAWQPRTAWIKVNGQWRKSKKNFFKRDNIWRAGSDQ